MRLAYADFMLGIDTYCYAFVSLQTRRTYFRMFELLFQTLSRAARQHIQ